MRQPGSGIPLLHSSREHAAQCYHHACLTHLHETTRYLIYAASPQAHEQPYTSIARHSYRSCCRCRCRRRRCCCCCCCSSSSSSSPLSGRVVVTSRYPSTRQSRIEAPTFESLSPPTLPARRLFHGEMETISISSPSAFHQSSPVIPQSTAATATATVPVQRRSNAKRKTPMAPKTKPVKTKADGIAKPKQSKSRNGTPRVRLLATTYQCSNQHISRCVVLCCCVVGFGLADERGRLCDVQGQATQVRRNEADVSAVSEAERGLRRLQEGLQVALV